MVGNEILDMHNMVIVVKKSTFLLMLMQLPLNLMVGNVTLTIIKAAVVVENYLPMLLLMVLMMDFFVNQVIQKVRIIV